jgi:IclR family transcriptional regulator, acetate operon repressor
MSRYHNAGHVAQFEEGTQAIDRAARILVRLVEADEAVTLSGVVQETRLPKSTAARLLRALERTGLAQRRHGGGFRPGPVLVEYARRDASIGDLGALAWPFLQRLGRETGETTNVAVPTADGVARLAQLDTAHPLGVGNWNWVGRAIPPHASSMGKLFMAYGALPLPAGRLAKLGPNAITSGEALAAEVERVRADGFATTWDELEAGLCSTAAPVYGASGNIIAAISVSAPTVRTARERLAELSERVVETASDLSDVIRMRDHEGVTA